MRSIGAMLVLIAVAGCGTSGGTDNSAAAGPSTATAAIDPCTLVTRDEAAAALGGAVGAAQKQSGFGQFDQCQYLAEGERIADMGTVTVQVHGVDIASKRKAFADAGEATETVEGIGEAAFWAPGSSALYTGKHGRTASFSAAKAGIDAKAASRALAEKGLSRLP